MKILIFGGTTEGRELASVLSAKEHKVCVSVATDTGRSELAGIEGIDVMTGRKDAREMRGMLAGFDLCVDATHPYALEAGSNIRKACLEEKVRYLRLLRDFQKKVPFCKKVSEVSDAEEAAKAVLKIPGNILLTTGVKELGSFDGIERDRLFVRVLPVPESLDKCARACIPARNIIAMYGPFSKDLNRSLIEQYDISCLVTKDGGVNGGFEEKIGAAEDAGIECIVIKRPQEEGLSLKEVINEIDSLENCTLRDV